MSPDIYNDERARKAGRRYQFEIGPKGQTRTLVLAHGDTREAELHLREVPGGSRMHAIIADLPYGIQHFGEISALLSQALPVWERLLLPGGTIALAWNATRIEREAEHRVIGGKLRIIADRLDQHAGLGL